MVHPSTFILSYGNDKNEKYLTKIQQTTRESFEIELIGRRTNLYKIYVKSQMSKTVTVKNWKLGQGQTDGTDLKLTIQ